MDRYLYISVFCCLTIVIFEEVAFLEACGGFRLNVDFIRNCGKNNSILLSNDFKPILRDDCTVIMTGCSVVKKTFKTAQISFDIIRNGVRHTGTKNACQLLDHANNEVQAMMDVMGVPKSCPVKEGTVCGQGKEVSIRRHRLKLTMIAGHAKGRAELKTNSGNSCFEFSGSLTRKSFFSG